MNNNKNLNKGPLINDLVKTGTMLTIAHILSKSYSGDKLFDNRSLYEILFTLLGLVVYYELVINIIPPAID